MKINIYYQDEFYGKEIADSLSRYICYCLEKNEIVKIVMSMNLEKFLNDDDDYHILCFTNLMNDIKHWGTLIGKFEKKIKGKKWKLKIIDLTWRDDFPIVTKPEEVVISSIERCLDWLSRLTINIDAREIKIEIAPDYLRNYYEMIDHHKKPKSRSDHVRCVDNRR